MKEENSKQLVDFEAGVSLLYAALEKREMINHFMSNCDKISMVTFTLDEHTLTVPLLHDKERRILAAYQSIRDFLSILSDIQAEVIKEKLPLVEQSILAIKEVY